MGTKGKITPVHTSLAGILTRDPRIIITGRWQLGGQVSTEIVLLCAFFVLGTLSGLPIWLLAQATKTPAERTKSVRAGKHTQAYQIVAQRPAFRPSAPRYTIVPPDELPVSEGEVIVWEHS